MNIKKALEHFEWKFKNHWKPSKTDLEAYNTLVKYVEQNNTEQFNDNQLFGKIFISFYGELLRYYNTTVFDKQPQIAINKILDTPIETLIKKFMEKATVIEQSKQFEVHGVLKHPQAMTKEQKQNIEIIEPIMSYEEAKNNLSAMINNALNSFH